MNVFEIVKNLNEKGDGPLSKEVIQAEYSPYIINRAMSNTKDTIFFANEMNRLNTLDKDQQYDFYYYGLSKRKRFGKWNKLKGDKEAIEIIKEYFNYSYHKAKEAVPLLIGVLDEIKKEIDKGGKKK